MTQHIFFAPASFSAKPVASEYLWECQDPLVDQGFLFVCLFSFDNLGHFQGIPWKSSGYDYTLTAESPGPIPGQGTKIPQAEWYSQKISYVQNLVLCLSHGISWYVF